MRPHRLPSTSGRGPLVEPSGGAIACTPEKWVSPLPPPHGSPVIGKGKDVVVVLFFLVCGWTECLGCFWLSDWHDGGNGASTSQSRPPVERGHCLYH